MTSKKKKLEKERTSLQQMLSSERAQEEQKISNEHEKDQLQKECQQEREAYGQQMEEMAKLKIEEMHSQFMSANQVVIEQKTTAEASASQWREKVGEIQVQFEALLHRPF